MESADTRDLKSLVGDNVPVQVRSAAPAGCVCMQISLLTIVGSGFVFSSIFICITILSTHSRKHGRFDTEGSPRSFCFADNHANHVRILPNLLNWNRPKEKRRRIRIAPVTKNPYERYRNCDACRKPYAESKNFQPVYCVRKKRRASNLTGNCPFYGDYERCISRQTVAKTRFQAAETLKMKAKASDWYKKIWALDIKNMSWVENTSYEVDYLIDLCQLKGTERILDLACGYGRHALEFAKRGYEVVGVDITEVYIADAKKSTQELGRYGQDLCAKRFADSG